MTIEADGVAAAKELEDWPGTGRSLAAGLGDGFTKTVAKSLGVQCNFEGVPLERDLPRLLGCVLVDATCATKPNTTVVRMRCCQAITPTRALLIRIDGYPQSDSEANAVLQNIWRTLTNSSANAIEGAVPRKSSTALQPAAAPVVGGPGLRLRDYGLIRPAYLAGEFTGSLLSAIGGGALLCLGLMALRIRPIPSLILSQLLLILLRLWGGEEDGVWQFDWLNSIPAAIVGIAVLQGWAHRRWKGRATGSMPETASTD